MVAAAAALLDHLPGIGGQVTGDFERALRGDLPWFMWRGLTPGDPVGRYWIPALWGSDGLAACVAEVASEHAISELEATDRVRLYHSGMTKDRVAWSIAAPAEIDHLPRAEQERRYAALAAATGLSWALLVFTGGKSVHAYLAFDRALAPSDPLRERIQRLLVVILEGDTRITDPGRLMRLPGAVGEHDGTRREQPVLHLDPSAHYAPEDIAFRLTTYAESMGIHDVDDAYKALQLAEQLEVEARHQIAEAADELRAQAALLRSTRSAVDPDDIALAYAMLGRTPPGSHGSGGGLQNGSGTSRGTTFIVDDLSAYANMAAGTRRVTTPCCGDGGPGSSGPAGVVLQAGNDPVVYCHRCRHTIIRRVPTPTLRTPAPTASAATVPTDAPITPAGVTRHLVYRDSELVMGRFMPFEPVTARVTVLAGPKGCGKSEVMSQMSRAVQAVGGDVVAVAHLRALVSGLARRMGPADGRSLPDYRDANVDMGGSVAVCVNSLHRVEIHHIEGGGPIGVVEPRRIGILIVDEIEQALRALYSGTMSGPESADALRHLRNIIRQADRLVVADADVSDLTFHWLRTLLPDADIELREAVVPNRYTYRIHRDQVDLVQQLTARLRAGERIVVPCMSAKFASVLARLARDAGAHVGLIDVDWARDHRAELEDLDAWIAREQPTCLIYTPVLSTGVSLDTKGYWDRIMGFGCPHVGTAQDMHQMVHRVRNPRCTDIDLCITPGGVDRPTDKGKIRPVLLSLAARAQRRMPGDCGALSEYAMVEFEGGKVTPADPAHLDLYVDVLAHERSWGGHGGRLCDAMPAYLKAVRAKTVVVESAAAQARDKLAEAKEALKTATERVRWVDAAAAKVSDPEKLVKAREKAAKVKEDAKASLQNAKAAPALAAAATARDTLRSAREAARKARAEAIHQARELTDAEALDIREPDTTADALAVERWAVQRHYGDADVETIIRDRDGRRRVISRRWAHLSMFRAGGDDRTALAYADAGDGTIAHARHRWAWAAVADRMLQDFGVPTLPFGIDLKEKVGTPPIEIPTGTWAAAAKRAQELRHVLAELGITIPRNITQAPGQLLEAVLRSVGITLHHKRVRADGRREYRYTIELKDVIAVAEDGKRYRERLVQAYRDARPSMVVPPFSPEIEEHVLAWLNAA